MIYSYYVAVVISIIIIAALAFCLLKKDSTKLDKILFIIFVISFVAIIINIYLNGSTSINSDTAMYNRLRKGIVHEKSLILKDWTDRNGELYIFHIVQIGALLSAVFKDTVMSMVVSVFVMALISVGSGWYLSKKMFNDNSWLISIPIIYLFLMGREAEAVITIQGSYLDKIIVFTLCIGLLFEVFYSFRDDRKYMVKTIICSILIILMTASGARYLADYVVPAILALILSIYVDYGKEDKEISFKTKKAYAITFAVIVIATIIGLLCYKFLCNYHPVQTNSHNEMIFAGSSDTIKYAWTQVFFTILNCFGYDASANLLSLYGFHNFVSIVVALLLCVIIPIIQLIHIKDEDEKTRLYLYFAYIHNALIIFIVTFFEGKGNVRYMVPSVYIFIILSCRWLYANVLTKAKIKRIAWLSMITVSVLIEALYCVRQSSRWEEIRQSQLAFVEELEAHGLKKGYGEYLNTYYWEAVSGNDLEFAAIAFDGTRFVQASHHVDKYVYEPSAEKSFILLSESENAAYAALLPTLFDEPIDQFVVEGVISYETGVDTIGTNNFYIYVFDYDIAADISSQ